MTLSQSAFSPQNPSPEPRRVALSWSSGKDSASALHLLRQTAGIEIAALITTFNCAADRVAMLAVRRGLVETQAARVGLPSLVCRSSVALFQRGVRNPDSRSLASRDR